MRDKTFALVAACAVLGLCISTGAAVFLATRGGGVGQIVPKETSTERFEREQLVKRERNGEPLSESDKAALRVLAERDLLRRLHEAENRGE